VTRDNRHYVSATLNGFFGDSLAEAGIPLAIPMSFREEGRDVAVSELELARRLQGAGRTVVVMLHGLMGDEVIFRETRWQASSASRPGHGARLAAELGVTVLYLRFNSGLHISENGRALSALLQSLVEAAGPALERLILVGHSLGGLVARSAGYYADLEGRSWVSRLSTVVLLGVPTQGSYLEQIANVSAVVLGHVGNLYTQLSGRIIEQRSHGIKDLRFGFMADEDWKDHPSDARLRASRTRIPPLPGVAYHVVVGTIAKNEDSVLALYFGDGLVGKRSAFGEALFRPADPLSAAGSYRVFPGTSHVDLLLSPRVGDHVVEVVRRSLGERPSPS
jgi:pimeloyl-ACP methyl ester carboxylesterase